MNKTVLDLLLMFAIPATSPGRGKMLGRLCNFANQASIGNATTCASGYRQMIREGVDLFEEEIANNPVRMWRPFAPLLRIAALIGQHLYSKERICSASTNQFRTLGISLFVLLGYLSDAIPEKVSVASSHVKIRTQTLYMRGLVCNMVSFEERYGIPWFFLLEDRFEASFLNGVEICAAKRTKYCLHEVFLNKTVAAIARTNGLLRGPKIRKPSKFRSPPKLSFTNIIFAKCLHQWVGYFGRAPDCSTGPLRVASFAIRQLAKHFTDDHFKAPDEPAVMYLTPEGHCIVGMSYYCCVHCRSVVVCFFSCLHYLTVVFGVCV